MSQNEGTRRRKSFWKSFRKRIIPSALWFDAAANGDVMRLLRFIEREEPVERLNAVGDSALHVAASAGHERVVIVLLGSQCRVNIRGRDGRTPLHCAAANGHVKVVRRLLNAGATADAVDSSGVCALKLAADAGHPEVIELIQRYYGYDIPQC